jgi:hypothetical protein
MSLFGFLLVLSLCVLPAAAEDHHADIIIYGETSAGVIADAPQWLRAAD